MKRRPVSTGSLGTEAAVKTGRGARETTGDRTNRPDDDHAIPAPAAGASQGGTRRRQVLAQLRALVTASHPRQGLATGVVVGVCALFSGRPMREALVAGLAVLVVGLVLGLDNDVVDRHRDLEAGVDRKPVSDGRLPAGNAAFAAVCLAIVAVPLSLQNGGVAALALLGSLLSGLLYNHRLRRTVLSWLPWAVGFALLTAFLAYGGWGGWLHGSAPTWAVTVLAALLGIGVHFLISLPDLVADNKSGVRHLPLRVALKLGAPRLLVVSATGTAVVVLGLLVAAFTVGLRQ